MAFPTYVGSGTIVKSTTGGTPGMPAGVQDDDVLIITCMTANQAVSTPSGWTLVPNTGTGNGTAGNALSVRLTAFWRRMAPGVTAPAIADVGDVLYAVIRAFRGCATTGDPWDFVTYAVQTLNVTAVSMTTGTTLGADRLIYHCVANTTDSNAAQIDFSSWANASLANFSDLGGDNTNQGTGGGLSHVAAEKATAGACGTTTATLNASSAQGKLVIAFKPPAAALLERTVADTITTVSESVGAVMTLIRTTLDDISDMFPDNVSRAAVNFSRSITDTITTATDSVTRSAISFARIVTDTVTTVTDSVERVKMSIRTALDTTTLSEGVSRTAIAFSRTVSDTVTTVTESVSRFVQFVRTSLDTTNVTDSIIAVKLSILVRTVSDTVVIGADSVVRTVAFLRALSDTTTVSDALAKVMTAARTAVDTVVTSDTVTRLFNIVRTLIDTTTVTDSVSRAAFVLVRITVDTVTSVTDSLFRVANKVRVAAENLSVSDTISRAWQGARSLADTLPAISDTAVGSSALLLLRTASDSITGVTDSISRTLQMTRSLVESIETSDFVTKVAGYARTIQDTVPSVTDLVVRGGVIVRRTVEDTVSFVGDIVIAFMGIPKFVGEVVRVAKSRNIFKVGRNDRDSIVGHSNKHGVRDDD